MMQRRQCLRWAAGLLCSAVSVPMLAASPAARQDRAAKLLWRERTLLGFGTTLWIRVGDESADKLEAALDAAVRELRSVERQMSLFDPDSAISRLNAQGVLQQPDPQLREVLSLSLQVARASGGSFDPSMQPLWQVWAGAAQAHTLPTAREVQRARARVNWRAIEVASSVLRLNLPRMGVSLNGIAQGYAADRVRALLQSHGIQHAMADTGETVTLGRSPAREPWTFGMEDAANSRPNERVNADGPVLLSDGRAIATSSDVHTAFSADRRYHHILDPRTGYSPAHWSSVTVIADRCVLADALTKVFFMLPPSQVMAHAQRWNVDVLLEDKAGRWTASEGARKLLRA